MTATRVEPKMSIDLVKSMVWSMLAQISIFSWVLSLGPISLPRFGSVWLYSRFGPYSRSKYHLSNEDKFERYGPVVREEAFMKFPVIHLYHKDDIIKVLKAKSDMPL